MKRRFFLPAIAVLLAVSGAFASSRYAIGYYTNSDTNCETPLSVVACTPGTQEECIQEGEGQYRYKLDQDDPESPCELLFYNPGEK